MSHVPSATPSRLARREAEREAEANSRPAPRRAAGRVLGVRATTVAVLGGLAVGLPLSGVFGAGALPAYAAEPVAPAATPSVLAIVDEATAAAADREIEGRGITLDEVGVARARVVGATLETPSAACAPVDAANGVAAGMTDAPAAPAVVVPLEDGTYTTSSGFGGRTHPIFGGARMHNGTDFAAPAGTPIRAAAAGTVIHSGANIGQPGTLVVLEHELDGQVWTTWYLHMYEQDIAVTEGQQVAAGDPVGLVGSAGNSTGPHLHLEVHEGPGTGGAAVDPAVWLTERGAVSSLDAGC